MRIVFRLFNLLFLVVLSLAAAGCMATPGWIHAGRMPVVVDVGGREYRVWSRRAGAGGQVQVVRMGYVPRSGHHGIREAMVRAAEQATGCTVARSSVAGDTGVINACIRC